MKLRTSSSEMTVVHKDITRFAPAWILYSILLLLTLMVSFETGGDWSTAQNLGYTGASLAIINFCYALINAQLLFGDLFNSRMANALHALPLRREMWFASHMGAGILFALVPNLVFTLVMATVCGSVPALPWLWLLTAMGQYLFFFGLAVFCAICVGSRFAMVVVYGLVNFGSLLVWWLVEELYVPMLSGVVLMENNFLRFSPVIWGTVNIPYEMAFGKMYQTVTVIPENLAYLGVLAAVGLAFIAGALVLYRLRHLESAGDFLAVKWLKPLFLVLYSMMMGVGCQWILGALTGTDWLYLIIGILIGYFTGQMLLMRTTRIFTWGTFRGLAVLMGALALSLVITWLDPLGIETWVPEPEQVEKVSLNYQETDNPELIEQIVRLHEDLTESTEPPDTWNGNRASVTLTYTMEDGTQAGRSYVTSYGEHRNTLRQILSHPEFVLGDILEIWDEAWLHTTVEDGTGKDIILTREKWAELKEVILLDCQAGSMAQNGNLHSGTPIYYFIIQYRDGDHYIYYDIAVYPDSENTIAWLEQQSFYAGYTGK